MWLPLTHPLLGTWPATQACAPDWELNWQPFDSQASTQSIESHQPGLYVYFFLKNIFRGGGEEWGEKEENYLNNNKKCFKKTLFIYFLARRQWRENERERNIDVRNINRSLLTCISTRDWTHSLGMCPDREFSDLLLCAMMPKQMGKTSQDPDAIYRLMKFLSKSSIFFRYRKNVKVHMIPQNTWIVKAILSWARSTELNSSQFLISKNITKVHN